MPGKDWSYAQLSHSVKIAGGVEKYNFKTELKGAAGLLLIATYIGACFAPLIIEKVVEKQKIREYKASSQNKYLINNNEKLEIIDENDEYYVVKKNNCSETFAISKNSHKLNK